MLNYRLYANHDPIIHIFTPKIFEVRFCITLFCLLVSIEHYGQELSICNWKGDKKAAVVLTFDDWLLGHQKIAAPLLIKNNIPGTFFITLNNLRQNMGSLRVLQSVVENGVEAANHTVSHPDLTSIPFEEATKEINVTKEFLDKEFAEKSSLSFAYPMGTKSPEIINFLKNDYVGARGVMAPNENELKYDFVREADDYYKVKTVRVWRILSRSKVSNWVKYAADGGGLLTFMIHSVYNDSIPKGWDAIHESFLEDIVDTLAQNKEQIWISTFEDAIQYHRERLSAKVKIIAKTSKELVFTLEHGLNQKKFDEKLTIKLHLNRREVLSVIQGGETLEIQRKEGVALFDVKPNGRKVRVNFKVAQ